jgi:DNA-binding XRE family transcriptional regulator
MIAHFIIRDLRARGSPCKGRFHDLRFFRHPKVTSDSIVDFRHSNLLRGDDDREMHYDRDDFIAVLGTRIKAMRKERGWTQMQMAQDFGYFLSHWQNIESGRKMSLGTMLRVANTFELTLEELLYGIKRRTGAGFGSKGFHLGKVNLKVKKPKTKRERSKKGTR